MYVLYSRIPKSIFIATQNTQRFTKQYLSQAQTRQISVVFATSAGGFSAQKYNVVLTYFPVVGAGGISSPPSTHTLRWWLVGFVPFFRILKFLFLHPHLHGK